MCGLLQLNMQEKLFSPFFVITFMKKAGLGPLELKILSVLSSLGKASVKDIYERVASEEDIAFSTVATVLNRLYLKGYVKRELIESARPFYVYEISGEIKNQGSSLVKDFLSAFKGQIALYFEGSGKLSKEEVEKIKKILDELS